MDSKSVAGSVDVNMQTLPPGEVGKFAVQGATAAAIWATLASANVRNGWNLTASPSARAQTALGPTRRGRTT